MTLLEKSRDAELLPGRRDVMTILRRVMVLQQSQLSAFDRISVPTSRIRRYFFTLERATTSLLPATLCATSCVMAGATKRKSNEYPDDEGFVANDSDGSD